MSQKTTVILPNSTDKLQKMYTLWPPYSHWFLYFIHVVGVVATLKLMYCFSFIKSCLKIKEKHFFIIKVAKPGSKKKVNSSEIILT